MKLFSKKTDGKSVTDTFLRIESAAILFGVFILYYWQNGLLSGAWLLFLLFAALPEAAWLSYIQRNPASWWPNLIYNVIHMYAAPIFFIAVLWPYRPIYLLGWIANIALSRLIGFGFHTPRKAA